MLRRHEVWRYGWIFASLLACTTKQGASLQESVREGKCEEAAERLTRLDASAGQKILEGAQEVGGATASYGVAAVGYTADVVVTGAAGIVSVAVYCPLVLMQIAACSVANGGCDVYAGTCYDNPWDHLPEAKTKGDGPNIGPGLGSKGLTTTATWRESPSAIAMVAGMREVAACYERRDTRDGLVKASLQLQQIHSAHLYESISTPKRQAVDQDIGRVRARLEAVAPGYHAEVQRQQKALAQAVFAQQAPVIWRDLETGTTWRLQLAPVTDGAQARSVCEGASAEPGQSWHLPSLADVAKARAHGLMDSSKNPAIAKARSAKVRVFVHEGSESYAKVDLATGAVGGGEGQSERLGLLCMQ